MAIDIEKYRTTLKQQEGDVLGAIERSEADARDAASAEVEDAIDRVNSGESKDAAFDETNRNYERLREIREALERIEAGTFGRCVICGREIGEARLEAVPWTPYCKEDAERLDDHRKPPTL